MDGMRGTGGASVGNEGAALKEEEEERDWFELLDVDDGDACRSGVATTEIGIELSPSSERLTAAIVHLSTMLGLLPASLRYTRLLRCPGVSGSSLFGIYGYEEGASGAGKTICT